MINKCVFVFEEQKRDVYDLCGKDGLTGRTSSSASHSMARHGQHFPRGAPSYRYTQFRDPYDVFREFFGSGNDFNFNDVHIDADFDINGGSEFTYIALLLSDTSVLTLGVFTKTN